MSKPAKLTWRVAHSTPTAYLLLAVVYPLSFVAPLPGGLREAAPWAIFAVEMAMMAAFVRHQRVLCGICASLTAQDGADAAERHAWKLRRHHDRWFRYWGTAAIWVSAVVTALFHLPPTVFRIGVVIALICASLFFQAWNVHMLLTPWCPDCRGGWEDGGAPEPAPEPDPSSTKQLPV
jgi:hypothetical protein